MTDFRREFIRFCIECGVMRFGSFVTKSGRTTPYFFNAGLFNTGARLDQLAQFYAKAILNSEVRFDMLFGPAYKGIPLAAATAVALARSDRDVPFAFNRKEAKDHGEGGNIIGAPLEGRVLVIDDVMTAGTAVRDTMKILDAHNAKLAGVAISLDRMERGTGDQSAVQEVRSQFDVPVITIASVDDLLSYIRGEPKLAHHLNDIEAYRRQYGVEDHA
ncbi:MAG TPA: orotate phosphoribosyltransferase [Burkholderiales bacterium]|nr:orotate phosphoribosyltransferase [Burkholderiales bacterium]